MRTANLAALPGWPLQGWGFVMERVKTYLIPLARVLMASLFIWSAVRSFRNPGGSAQYMANAHMPVPHVTVWVVLVFQIIAGLFILFGFQTRCAAAALAIFCLFTAFAVHLPAGDYGNLVNFYKNLVMAGGFFYVFVYGAGSLSIDA